MGVVLNPSSDLAKELRKWEQHHTTFSIDEDGDSKPGNPYVYRPYPRMLYKAHKRPNGQYAVMEQAPNPLLYPDGASYERAILEIEQFNKSCQLIVQNEAQERQEANRGWKSSPTEALEHAEALEQDMARAAAEANFHASRMSEKAQREWADAQEATSEHVVDVQGPRRGRQPRVVTGTGPIEG